MRGIALLAGLLLAGTASAATAVWTGKQEQVQTVTGQIAWRCEYDYAGQKLYFLFQTSCPATVEVQ
jgi:hypothetical protein